MSGVAQKVSYNMRKEISEKINRMPLKYFDTKTHGEVLSRVTNDVDTVSQTLNQSLSQMLTAATTLIGVLIMMFSINWIMTLASLIVIPVSVGLIAVVVKKSQKYFKTQQEYLGYVNGQVEEVYSGHNVMKAFNAEEREINKFTELNDTLYNSAWKSQFLSGMMMPIMTFVGNLGYVIVSILGGWLAIKDVIQVGDILSFVQYIRSFMQPISQTAQIANVLQSTAAAAERVFEFLNEEEEEQIVKNPVSTEGIKGEVTFEHVKFGYNPDQIIIKDFSAHVKPGQQAETDIKFGYCTEFIIMLEKEFTSKDEAEFKAYLESIGDSIVCVADDDVVKIHVHTNDPGLAIQKALTFGQLSRMKIDNMREEHQEKLIKDAEKVAAQQAENKKKEHHWCKGEGMFLR